MNFLGVHLLPALIEEGFRELERERMQQRRVREAHRARRRSRIATLTATLRHGLQPGRHAPVPEGC